MTTQFLVNIDVANLGQATQFYEQAFGLKVSRPFGSADPFGNGLCLLEFLGRGYDEIAT